MAEAAAGFDPRRILLVGGVMVVIIFSLLFFFFRSCSQSPVGKKPGYTLIYSNMELRDAANVIARLKELTIPYEIRDEGRSIAVPKEKADQARLSLAEKNLPAGGVVGWEIFDESRLGATDFDRRIQLIRAISGELSRTIRRIAGVEDVRVQVVIPETKLFAATTAPVTAAVMIRLSPGFELALDKINGIVHLVASSVENLQPENVTVVDEFGHILTGRAAQQTKLAPVPAPTEASVRLVTPEVIAGTAEVVLKKVVAVSAPTTTISTTPTSIPQAVTTVASLSAEERILYKAQAKKDLESELGGKAQELLNRFYPINSAIVKVAAEVLPAKEMEIKAKNLKIKKLYVIVLIDNRVDFTKNLKLATFTTVAAAVGYNKRRGDRIIIQRVPFHLATPPIEKTKARTAAVIKLPFNFSRFAWVGGAAVVVILIYLIVNSMVKRPREELAEEVVRPAPTPQRERMSKLDQVKTMAEQNPQQIAELLKRWLSE